MPKRLAITIAGAVSLGSFEAGVLYEVFQALAAHNASPGADPITIDVMTGASAGGMTVAIGAQKAFFEASSLSNPYNNSLYNPWVKDISIDGLLKLQSLEPASHSLLSSNLIEQIAGKYLIDRYSTHLGPAQVKHSAIGTTLHIGLALSNLNGVDYSATDATGVPFVYTDFQDEIHFLLDGTSDNQNFWKPVMNAALACGAFPFAFRPRNIMRHRQEYLPPGVADDPALLPFSADPQRMTYTDGGVFQNEPLGMAKNFVDLIDNHRDNENRFYLFVSPHAKKTSGNHDFDANDATFLKMLSHLGGAVINQAGFQDWAMALKKNKQIALLDERADQLKKLIILGTIAPNALAPASQSLLDALYSAAGPNDRQNDLARLASQYAQDCRDLDGFDSSNFSKNVWLDSILILEKAASLGVYDKMEVIGITAQDSELASSALTAFMGFFDQRYRDHDYDVGRQKAQAVLTDPTKLAGLGPLLGYVPQPTRPLDNSLKGLTIKDADPDVVDRVRDRLEDDVKEMLSDAGVNSIELALAGPTIIKPALNKLLGL